MDTTYVRPSKDESFMEIAESVSMRSTCLRRRYGAVIVSKDGRIVSTGYNGAPRHRANCTDLKYCLRDELKIKPGTHYELCRSVHAEANAIINGDPLEMALYTYQVLMWLLISHLSILVLALCANA